MSARRWGVRTQEKAASVRNANGDFEPTEVGMSVLTSGALVKF